MTLTRLQSAIVTVLAGQSPGYLAAPSCSAFVAAGLIDADAVEQELLLLEADGLVNFSTTTIALVDEHGNPLLDTNNVQRTALTDQGWLTTDAGRNALQPPTQGGT